MMSESASVARFKIVAAGSFPRKSVKQHHNPIHWSANYSQDEREYIDAAWSNALDHARASGRSLYDSPLFRLGDCRTEGHDLVLCYGDTSYRDYVGTRAPNVPSTRADPVGTAVVPVTTDGFIPLGRRSSSADVNPGRFFTFGGFFDRDHDYDPETGLPDIFACISREVREELSIDLPASAFKCIGVIYDLRHPHPELSFSVEMQACRNEVLAAGWKSELDDLTFVHKSQITDFLARHDHETTDTLVGALQIFQSISV